MSVYAVYARAPQSTLWSRREVCATKEEADRIAGAAVDGSAAEERPAAASSVVVEWEDGTNVPAELADQWVAPVVSRFGEPDQSPAETAQASEASGRA